MTTLFPSSCREEAEREKVEGKGEEAKEEGLVEGESEGAAAAVARRQRRGRWRVGRAIATGLSHPDFSGFILPRTERCKRRVCHYIMCRLPPLYHTAQLGPGGV